MTKTRSMTRNNVGWAPWSDLNHDLLFLVMMQLGVIDFLSFSGVCKSWRSFALSNRKMFMASRPPMLMSFSNPYKEARWCFLVDLEGRKFKILFPNSGVMFHVGLTCGYLVLLAKETKDFWLVNPIKRHQLHFPAFRGFTSVHHVRAILVFSPSIFDDWVLVVINMLKNEVWYCTAGKGSWNHILSDSPICDLFAVKGKIYTIHMGLGLCLCELRLSSNPKLTILKTVNFQKPQLSYPYSMFASSGQNLYVIHRLLGKSFKVFELDVGETKCVLLKENAIGEYAFFFSVLKHGVTIKPEPWAAEPLSQFKRYDWLHKTGIRCRQGIFFYAVGWYFYFPHLCLDVNILRELST